MPAENMDKYLEQNTGEHANLERAAVDGGRREGRGVVAAAPELQRLMAPLPALPGAMPSRSVSDDGTGSSTSTTAATTSGDGGIGLPPPPSPRLANQPPEGGCGGGGGDSTRSDRDGGGGSGGDSAGSGWELPTPTGLMGGSGEAAPPVTKLAGSRNSAAAMRQKRRAVTDQVVAAPRAEFAPEVRIVSPEATLIMEMGWRAADVGKALGSHGGGGGSSEVGYFHELTGDYVMLESEFRALKQMYDTYASHGSVRTPPRSVHIVALCQAAQFCARRRLVAADRTVFWLHLIPPRSFRSTG